MKDAFYFSGIVNTWDANCADCPYRVIAYDGDFCQETMQTIKTNGKINHNCPFIEMKGD